MKEEAVKIVNHVFAIRKGGENGEQYFVTLGNMMLSTKLHDTEESAMEEIEELNTETIARMLVAVMNACEEMINEKMEEK